MSSGVFDASTLVAGGVAEEQIVTVNGGPTGGTFKLAYKGQLSDAIAFNASAASLQAILRAMTRLGGVTVTGSAGGPWTVKFTGQEANRNTPPLVVTSPALTGGTSPTVTVAESVKGSSVGAGLFYIKSGLVLMKSTDGKLVRPYDGSGAANIVGIFDGVKEFMSNDSRSNDPIAIYNHNVVFDRDVVQGFATFAADLATWGVSHACEFRSQGV